MPQCATTVNLTVAHNKSTQIWATGALTVPELPRLLEGDGKNNPLGKDHRGVCESLDYPEESLA